MIDIDLDALSTIEFGVGRNTDTSPFVLVPADGDVANVLIDMVRTNLLHFAANTDWRAYEPSEKYGSTEYLQAALHDSLVKGIRKLHDADNLPVDAEALAAPDGVFCYFARLFDVHGGKLTALRRAAQFKSLLKPSLLRRLKGSDNYGIESRPVFKLDSDFDVLALPDDSYLEAERLRVRRSSSPTDPSRRTTDLRGASSDTAFRGPV